MLSTSAATDPNKFYWMRYTQERATNVTVKGETVKIVKGTLFGVREVRGSTTDEVLLRDGTKFRLALNKSDVLMNRSKPFNGKIKMDSDRQKPAAKRSSPVQVKAKPKPKPPKTKVKTPLASIKIVLPKKPMLKVTKLTPASTKGPIKIKLSEIEMPVEDDFTDHDLPAEFRRFAKVESSGYWLAAIASDAEMQSVSINLLEDFNEIVKESIQPHVKAAKDSLDKAIKEASVRVKAWALTHLAQAKKLGKNTVLFEKLVNNPTAAVTQIAHSLLGVTIPNTAKTNKIDDVLDGLTF